MEVLAKLVHFFWHPMVLYFGVASDRIVRDSPGFRRVQLRAEIRKLATDHEQIDACRALHRDLAQTLIICSSCSYGRRHRGQLGR